MRMFSISTQHRERHREVDVALGDVLVQPSATSITPIMSRNERARILTVGWRWTKSLTAPAKTIMKPTATTTADHHHADLLTMPTAVITESSENTMSSSMICDEHAREGRCRLGGAWPSAPSSLSWISSVPWPGGTARRMSSTRSRPEISCPNIVNSGAVSRDDPGDGEQQQDAHQHGQAEAELAGLALLLRAGASRPGSR